MGRDEFPSATRSILSVVRSVPSVTLWFFLSHWRRRDEDIGGWLMVVKIYLQLDTAGGCD